MISMDYGWVRETYLDPERGALSNRGELCGLEVREAEGREVAVLLSKLGEAVYNHGKLGNKYSEGFTEKDEVCVAAPTS